MTAINLTTTFELMDCSECGIAYALQDEYVERRRKDKRRFYCPNGHTQFFSGESDAAKIKRLQDEAAAARARTDQVRADRDAVTRRLTATKGVVTRTKKRVGGGVCPCCNRTFQQLARHMQAKHPDYAESAS